MEFEVSKEKGGKYYVHPTGKPKEVVPGSHADKKAAMHLAAELEGVPYKDYLKLRKEHINGSRKTV